MLETDDFATFDLVPLEDMDADIEYIIVLTTIEERSDDKVGISYPSQEGLFRINV
jgi:hypothetical protein